MPYVNIKNNREINPSKIQKFTQMKTSKSVSKKESATSSIDCSPIRLSSLFAKKQEVGFDKSLQRIKQMNATTKSSLKFRHKTNRDLVNFQQIKYPNYNSLQP